MNKAMTYHYLKNCDQGVKVAVVMAQRLEEAEQKEAAIQQSLMLLSSM